MKSYDGNPDNEGPAMLAQMLAAQRREEMQLEQLDKETNPSTPAERELQEDLRDSLHTAPVWHMDGCERAAKRLLAKARQCYGPDRERLIQERDQARAALSAILNRCAERGLSLEETIQLGQIARQGLG